MDPITLLMFGLIAVMIFFMFRNGKKRQAAQQELQNSVREGAEVMLQSGIFGTIEDIDDEANRVTVRSGTSTIVVHRSSIAQVLKPSDFVEEVVEIDVAPDDDPKFGEHIAEQNVTPENDASDENTDGKGENDKPQA